MDAGVPASAHFLRILGGSGAVKRLPISAADFVEAVAAKTQLLATLDIEEKFRIVIDNYAELERSLLDLTLEKMLHVDFEWSSIRDDVQLVNRRLVNLMSSCKLYVDQVRQDVTLACPDDGLAQPSVIAAFSREYDATLGYRALEALRNYCQHRSLPVGSISYPMENIGEPGATLRRRHAIVVSLDTERLSKNGGFKAAVLAELMARGRFVPIVPMVRSYVQGLSNVQRDLRDLTSEVSARNRARLTALEDRARTAAGTDRVRLLIYAEDHLGRTTEGHDVFGDIAERLASLQKETRLLTALERGYVSNEALLPQS